MKVKKRNLFELVLQVLLPVLAFLPAFYCSEDWVDDFDGYTPVKRLVDRRSGSLFDALFNTDTLIQVLGMALFAAFVCGVVLFAMQLTARGAKRNWLPTVILACVETGLLVVCALLIECNDFAYYDTEFRYSLQATGYIMLVVMAALAVITVLGYRKAAKMGVLDEEPKVVRAEVVGGVSQADELQKYKDLLDKGVISQEEFDAKKKQLLGL